MTAKLKVSVERCAYTLEDGEGHTVYEIDEVIAIEEYDIPIVYNEETHLFDPVDKWEMLEPFISLIELAVEDDWEYWDIAESAKVETELAQKVNDDEPASEIQLVYLLARLMYASGATKIVPPTGNILYHIIYKTTEAIDEAL